MIRRASDTLYFFTFRDSHGSVQLVVKDEALGKQLMQFPLESVVQIQGQVLERKQKAKGKDGLSNVSPSATDLMSGYGQCRDRCRKGHLAQCRGSSSSLLP